MRRYQQSAPAVADHLATTWHARGYDRDTSKSRLKQHARHALAMRRWEREDVGEAEQCRHIGSRSGGDHIGGMLVDLGLRNRERALAFTRSDQQETDVWLSPMDQRRR